MSPCEWVVFVRPIHWFSVIKNKESAHHKNTLKDQTVGCVFQAINCTLYIFCINADLQCLALSCCAVMHFQEEIVLATPLVFHCRCVQGHRDTSHLPWAAQQRDTMKVSMKVTESTLSNLMHFFLHNIFNFIKYEKRLKFSLTFCLCAFLKDWQKVWEVSSFTMVCCFCRKLKLQLKNTKTLWYYLNIQCIFSLFKARYSLKINSLCSLKVNDAWFKGLDVPNCTFTSKVSSCHGTLRFLLLLLLHAIMCLILKNEFFIRWNKVCGL